MWVAGGLVVIFAITLVSQAYWAVTGREGLRGSSGRLGLAARSPSLGGFAGAERRGIIRAVRSPTPTTAGAIQIASEPPNGSVYSTIATNKTSAAT